MKKIAALNILSGFSMLLFMGMVGVFLRLEVVQHYYFHADMQLPWKVSLFKSSHAHGTLFALIQIVYGLSIPYSICNTPALIFQSIGFLLGTLVMSVFVFLESFSSPNVYAWSLNQFLIGIGLGVWMLAIAWHSYGIAGRIWRD